MHLSLGDFARKGMVQDMMTIGGFWAVPILLGGAMLLFLGLTFLFVTRSARGLSVWMRCPITGDTNLVQYIPDEDGYVTDAISCGACPNGQPISCGLPCLTRGAHIGVTAESVT
jgi:hypothetical protein